MKTYALRLNDEHDCIYLSAIKMCINNIIFYVINFLDIHDCIYWKKQVFIEENSSVVLQQ
jgi:hypothetical protein